MSIITAHLPRTKAILAFLSVFVLAQMSSITSAYSQTVPGAPAGVAASAGNGQATITFNAPASDGGSPIVSYWVTSSPGNIIGSGSSSPIIVTGLANGTAYTFVVSATNSYGTGPNSSSSNSVTPIATSPQTITFNNPGAQNFGTTPNLTAVATSNLTPTFSSSTTGVCTITSGGLLSFVTAGTCTINANQAGNASFQAAPTVTRSFTVNPVVPAAPTIGTATAGNTTATVTFTAPATTGGSAVTGYTVTSSLGGITGTGSTSPITLTGLTNGVAYTFTVTATNGAGTSPASAASNQVTPGAASITLSPSDESLPAATSGSPYSVSLSATGGTAPYTYAVTYGGLPDGLNLNPLTGEITGTLVGSGTLFFEVTATDQNSATASASYSLRVNPAASIALSPSAGALPAATSGSPYSVSLSATGGTAPYTYAVTSGALPAGLNLHSSSGVISGSPSGSGNASFTVTATDANSVTVSAAYTMVVSNPGPSTVQALFQNNIIWLGEPDSVIPNFTANNIGNNIAFQTAFFGVIDAIPPLPPSVGTSVESGTPSWYSRTPGSGSEQNYLFSPRTCIGPNGTSVVTGSACSSSTSSIPFNIDGSFDADNLTLSSKGTFSGVSSAFGGSWQRVVYGDFNLQHSSDTGSSTASLNGRVAWQTMTSPKTTLGYYVDGQLAHSNIAGTFAGEQSTYGVAVGGYGVHALDDQLKLKGFFSLGAGQNNLEMTDTVLALESDYLTRSALVGAALSGVVQQEGFEVRPELSLNYGRTWIGDMDFTGRAFGYVDDTLSVDAGQVTLANMMLRPEVRVPLDGLSGTDSLQVVTFAPRLMCEQIKAATSEENCGGGAEVGFSGRSADGLSSVTAKLQADRIGGTTRSLLNLHIEHRF